MLHLALIVVAGSAAYWLIVMKKGGRLTADGLFVAGQTLMAVGSLSLLREEHQADRLYSFFLAYTLVVFIIVSSILRLSLREVGSARELAEPRDLKPSLAFWTLLILSVVVVVLYYRAVGYSAFIRGLQAQFGGTSEDIAGLRLESYSGSRYLFPGYVNQVKNVLLPGLVILAISYWHGRGVLQRRKFVATGLVLIVLYGLLGTAQRGAFVAAALTLLVYLYLRNRGRFGRGATALGLLTIVLLITSTVALGRSGADLPSEPTVAARGSAAAGEIVERFMLVNQGAGVVGFRYIYTYTEVQGGREWLRSLSGLLPGQGGSDLATRIFAYRYGSDRGTSPPAIWGSIYHNFGVGGVLVAPAVLAILLVGVTRAAFKRREKSSMEILGISGVFVTFGLWVAGSPIFLLNSGLLVYLAFWLVGSSLFRRQGSIADREKSQEVRHLPVEVLIDPPRHRNE